MTEISKQTSRRKVSPLVSAATYHVLSEGQRVSNVRVSSTDQHTARQLEGLDLDRHRGLQGLR